MTRAKAIPETVTVHIPFRIVKRGGRKEMLLPPGAPPQRKADNTLVKALARAFRWKRILESGQFVTVTELAEHENLALTYVTRVLRLSLLAPELVEMVVNGRQPPEMTLAAVLRPFPVDWEGQSKAFNLPIVLTKPQPAAELFE